MPTASTYKKLESGLRGKLRTHPKASLDYYGHVMYSSLESTTKAPKTIVGMIRIGIFPSE